MTTRRRGYSRVTGGRRWRKCFSTSHAAAIARKPDEQCGSRARHVFAAPRRRDGAALLVSAALTVRAADRARLLAGRADADVGLPADLSRGPGEPLRPGWRHAGRRRNAVGHPIPWAARVFD